mgnify:FL=1
MNLRKPAALLIAVAALLMLLCSCGGAALREDVKTYCGIDKAGEESIAALFTAFDEAFDRLCEMARPSDDDMYLYALRVHEAYKTFDKTFQEVYEPKKDAYGKALEKGSQEHEDWIDFLLDDMDVSSANLRLSTSFVDYMNGDANGEDCCYEAINLVNECSRFFYGAPHLSDDDLNRLTKAS